MGKASCLQEALHSDGAAVKLFRAEGALTLGGGRTSLSPEMRLSELHAAFYEPVYLLSRDARPGTLDEVGRSVKFWKLYTGDPPINTIDAWHNRDFVVGLKARPGRKAPTASNNTVRKHCQAIQAMLDLCGPVSRDNREGLGLLDEVPYIPRPRAEQKPAEDCFTLSEVEILLANADAARLPDQLPCSPGDYLRRVYLMPCNTGLRIGGVMGMCWSHYHETHLLLPARLVMKGVRGQRVELNDAAREVIESMRGYDSERIFPYPRKWPASRHGLYDQHALVAACLPPHRRFGFHALRKYYNNELARINPAACQKALGHASGRTTVDAYTSRTIVREANDQIVQPKWRRERQGRLFD